MATSQQGDTPQLQCIRLAKTIWDLKICSDCQGKARCNQDICAAGRLTRLKPFLRYYRTLSNDYDWGGQQATRNALSNHDELFKLIKDLSEKRQLSKNQIMIEYFGSLGASLPGHSNEQDRAMRLASRILLMVESSGGLLGSFDELESGKLKTPWEPQDTLRQFLEKRLPQGDHPLFANSDIQIVGHGCRSLKARVLKKRAKLKFRLTEDMARHLHLDRKSHTVEIFQCTSFLKEHLMLTKGTASIAGDDGVIPRQLALEIIDSIQKVLFPFSDAASMKILKHLVSRCGFDPDCLRFESAAIRIPEEEDVRFYYFGERLAILLDEVENPRPHGLVEKWLERKSGARYIMSATLGGVMIAVLLGIAALAISGYQTWITYQAWQHPISPSS